MSDNFLFTPNLFCQDLSTLHPTPFRRTTRRRSSYSSFIISPAAGMLKSLTSDLNAVSSPSHQRTLSGPMCLPPLRTSSSPTTTLSIPSLPLPLSLPTSSLESESSASEDDVDPDDDLSRDFLSLHSRSSTDSVSTVSSKCSCDDHMDSPHMGYMLCNKSIVNLQPEISSNDSRELTPTGQQNINHIVSSSHEKFPITCVEPHNSSSDVVPLKGITGMVDLDSSSDMVLSPQDTHRLDAAKQKWLKCAGLASQKYTRVASYILSDEAKLFQETSCPSDTMLPVDDDSTISDSSPPVSPITTEKRVHTSPFPRPTLMIPSYIVAYFRRSPTSFPYQKSSSSFSLSRRSSIRSVSSISSSSTLIEGSPLIIPGTLTIMRKVTGKREREKWFWLECTGKVCWQSPRKGSNIKSIDIADIKEVRRGFDSDTLSYRQQLTNDDRFLADRWLTLIHLAPDGNRRAINNSTGSGRVKMMHVIAESATMCKLWFSTLAEAMQNRKDALNGISSPPCPDSPLSFTDVVSLCQKMGIYASTTDLEKRFTQCDRDQSGLLSFEQFQNFVQLLLNTRPEIEELFFELVDDSKNRILSLDKFKSFLINTQGVNVEVANKICHRYLPEQSFLTLDIFSSFLVSHSPILSRKKSRTVYQDMTRPLSEYFISSSHNTYLLGHQLHGLSSVEGYIRALSLGCRCVELDCWDGADGNPVIYHGHTLTTKISLYDVVKVIAKYAFIRSPYPLILSLEVHCCRDQQEKMVKCFKDVFGAMLVDKPISDDDVLPSPELLKHSILIKSKTLQKLDLSLGSSVSSATLVSTIPPPVSSVSSLSTSTSPIPSTISSTFSSDTDSLASTPTISRCSTISVSSVQDTSSTSFSKRSSTLPRRSNSTGFSMRRRPRIGQALSNISVYTASVKYRGFETTYKASEMFSLSERIFNGLYRSNEIGFRDHNRHHLTRIYPCAFRFSSDNFNPLRFWEAGCQMVSLNWQTHDYGMQIQQAMFNDNGASGYVLKPKRMRMNEIISKTPSTRHILHVKVISAQRLCKRQDSSILMDPYVQLELILPGDQQQISQKYRTSVRSNESFNPIWKEGFKFMFPSSSSDLAFLKFDIFDHADSKQSAPIASYCVRVNNIQQGYRHVPLSDRNGDQLFSTLYIKSECIIEDIPKI